MVTAELNEKYICIAGNTPGCEVQSPELYTVVGFAPNGSVLIMWERKLGSFEPYGVTVIPKHNFERYYQKYEPAPAPLTPGDRWKKEGETAQVQIESLFDVDRPAHNGCAGEIVQYVAYTYRWDNGRVSHKVYCRTMQEFRDLTDRPVGEDEEFEK